MVSQSHGRATRGYQEIEHDAGQDAGYEYI